MFIGNQTSCWAPKATDPFDFALAQNFRAFEWFPDKKQNVGWDEKDLDAAARQSIREVSGRREIRLSVHARWQANPLSAESSSFFDKDLDLARELGAALFNIHFAHENGVPAFVDAILPLISRTAEAGLQLSIENTPHHAPEQFNELFDRLRNLSSVQTKHVGMCLDIGHANLSSSTLNDYLGFFDRLSPEVPIVHLHLHENWGDADSHLPIFTGPSARNDLGVRGLLTRLKERQFRGSIILEQWPQPPSLLVAARDRLRELWGPAEPPGVAPGSSTPSSSPAPGRQKDLLVKLVQADRRSRSWREKLEAVCDMLGTEQGISSDALVLVAVYLKFLATGQIACAEDGRHFRPAHHARLAERIRNRLAQARTPENGTLLRRIYPSLPSSSSNFQQPEPLTRIRDIAHRNDIPSDLKKEIKNRLQNKLHRCAGPEDLVTSSELLARFTAPGANYPAEFVGQFKIFHEELKEFFSARSLEDRLNSLKSSGEPHQLDLIEAFLQQKAAANDLKAQLSLLQTLTDLRRSLSDRLSRPAEPDSPDFTLADIALEDFSFAVLSQIINAAEQQDPDSRERILLDALLKALTNLALSGVEPNEVSALESELRAWSDDLSSSNRIALLRLRATFLRCRRLAEQFGARTIGLFASGAEALGHALDIQENAVRVFSEAEIRRHVIFQASKLVDALIRANRERLRLGPWNVIVPGKAIGRANVLKSLAGCKESGSDSIVLLENAEGDEEIPKAVVGIALAHEMPHLAHLSVRARQAGVVFTACEDASEFERIRKLNGQCISLNASPDEVSFAIAGPYKGVHPKPQPVSFCVPDVNLAEGSGCILLESVSAELAGGKALGIRRLAELSTRADSGFRVPPSLAIPFAAFEVALRSVPEIESEYRKVARNLNQMPLSDFRQSVGHLQQLVMKLPVAKAITSEAMRGFPAGSPLVVRSSANGEDLPNFAGAGLYDSRINVPIADVALAVKEVWASLWSQRSAESRRAAAFPQDKAHMAVLLQELVEPEYSFVLHTVNPIRGDPNQLYAEIVVGLGETLASASASVAGTPYRLVADKRSCKVEVLALANFSQAIRPLPAGGLRRETIDYSKIPMSHEPEALKRMGAVLARIGAFVEASLGGPQDIEGAMARGKIYLVQARAQQGLPANRT